MSEGAANEDIEVDEWRRVSPLAMAVQGINLVARAFIPLAFVAYGIVGGDEEIPGFAALGAGGLLLFIFVALGFSTWLGWYRLRYRIGENDVRLEQGIISRTARSIPYDRIQDVSLEQKLLPRMLGLVEVKFETGAGGKDELKLTYVSEAEGEKLRETVREMVEGADETAPAQDRDEENAPFADTPAANAPVEARLLFAMPPKRLLIFGLFSFSLVIFAVLLGVMQQFEAFIPWGVEDFAEQFVEDKRYVDAAGYVEGLDTTARVLAVIYALVTVVFVGIASGIAKTFVRDWEFRLERTAKGFRRRRGLFTKTDVVMPVHRVQALIVSTGIIRRRFGWHGLSFISLAQDSGKANHDVAPFAKMEEIAPIANEAGFSLPDASEEWRRPCANYYFDKALIAGLFVTLIGIVGLTAAATSAGRLVPGLAVIAAIVLVIVGVIAARNYYLWRYDRHALDPAQVLSRRGWLAPRTQIANRVKLHSVEIAQGPLARWRGYCNLVFGMAGGRFSFDGLALEDAQKLRTAVLESIAEVDFANLPR